MLNKTLTLFFLILFSPALFSEHLPGRTDPPLGTGLRLAAFYDYENWDLFGEIRGSLAPSHPVESHFTLGALYRVHKNLKAGLFYELSSGTRQNDDWIVQDGQWIWKDSQLRFENSLVAELSPRFLLDFLPGENWVITLRNRWIYNFTFDKQTYAALPQLSYFWMVDREPLLTTSFSYGLYFPLNYGRTVIYKQSPYLNILYHLHPKVKLEARFSYETTTWTEGYQSLADGDLYEIHDSVFFSKVGFLFFL